MTNCLILITTVVLYKNILIQEIYTEELGVKGMILQVTLTESENVREEGKKNQ